MATKKKSNSNAKVVAGVAGGVAVLAAAAAGAYFLYGKDGAKNRKTLKGWMLKAKGEVMDQIEKLPAVDEVSYQKVVDAVAAKYKSLKNVDPADLAMMVGEMKRHWKNIKRHISPAPARKTAKKGGAKKKAGKK